MITYVNTVLVGVDDSTLLTGEPTAPTGKNTPSSDAHDFIIMAVDGDVASPYSDYKKADKIKIGVVTPRNTEFMDPANGLKYKPVIKWSNVLDRNQLKSYHFTKHVDDTEDKVEIDFSGVATEISDKLKEGEKRVVVRITYKDLPTRFRKWTESYEYVTQSGDTTTEVAQGLADLITKQYKRARVKATAASGRLTLEALPYDDDDLNDSINLANKVRFSVNVYWTDPTAPAFASKNKYALTGAKITKTPGTWGTTSAKLVRDREAQAIGYQGILNRGQGTFPIIKPDMVTDITKQYDGITIEFESVYRAADDQFRKTKECVEIYGIKDTLTGLDDALQEWAGLKTQQTAP